MTLRTCSFRQAQYTYDNLSPPEESKEDRYADWLEGLSDEDFLALNDIESDIWQTEYDARVESGEIKEWENRE